jgi:serine/threonine protein phosphatase PrpC
MSSGLRDKISHEEVDRLMEKTYEMVMKENFTSMVSKDVENNTRVVIEGIVRSLGMKNTAVVVLRKEGWKE